MYNNFIKYELPKIEKFSGSSPLFLIFVGKYHKFYIKTIKDENKDKIKEFVTKVREKGYYIYFLMTKDELNNFMRM